MAQQHQDNQPQTERQPFFCEGQVEIRSLAEGQGEEIFGYALLFNQRSRVMGMDKKFVEVIRPGACDRTDMADLQCHAFHSKFLSVVPNLRYGIDARGLWYSFPVDREDVDHVSVIRKIRRGDIKGSSFEFFTMAEDVDYQVEGDITLRYINHIPKIWHVGPVVTPAYPNTSAMVRDYERFQAEAQRIADEAAAAERRDAEAATAEADRIAAEAAAAVAEVDRIAAEQQQQAADEAAAEQQKNELLAQRQLDILKFKAKSLTGWL